MLHEKLQKILDVFKKEIDDDTENYFIVDDKDFQMFDYLDFVTLNLDPAEKEIVDISFYCGCPLPFASYLTKVLIDNDIKDFEIMENVYLAFDEDGKCKGLLFGDEAEEKYEEDIYKKVRYKKYKNMDDKPEEKKIGQINT